MCKASTFFKRTQSYFKETTKSLTKFFLGQLLFQTLFFLLIWPHLKHHKKQDEDGNVHEKNHHQKKKKQNQTCARSKQLRWISSPHDTTLYVGGLFCSKNSVENSYKVAVRCVRRKQALNVVAAAKFWFQQKVLVATKKRARV